MNCLLESFQKGRELTSTRKCGNRIVLRVMNRSGAGDGAVNAGADIFSADVAFKFGLLHELCGLFACAAEKEVAARCVEAVA